MKVTAAAARAAEKATVTEAAATAATEVAAKEAAAARTGRLKTRWGRGLRGRPVHGRDGARGLRSDLYTAGMGRARRGRERGRARVRVPALSHRHDQSRALRARMVAPAPRAHHEEVAGAGPAQMREGMDAGQCARETHSGARDSGARACARCEAAVGGARTPATARERRWCAARRLRRASWTARARLRFDSGERGCDGGAEGRNIRGREGSTVGAQEAAMSFAELRGVVQECVGSERGRDGAMHARYGLPMWRASR